MHTCNTHKLDRHKVFWAQFKYDVYFQLCDVTSALLSWTISLWSADLWPLRDSDTRVWCCIELWTQLALMVSWVCSIIVITLGYMCATTVSCGLCRISTLFIKHQKRLGREFTFLSSSLFFFFKRAHCTLPRAHRSAPHTQAQSSLFSKCKPEVSWGYTSQAKGSLGQWAACRLSDVFFFLHPSCSRADTRWGESGDR